MKVTKRNNTIEDLDIDKIHQVITWACEGLDVSVSQIEMKSHIQFYDAIKTSDIHEIIIKSAADLIDENNPDYQYVAARLLMFHLRKKAYNRFEPLHLIEQIDKLTKLGLYDDKIDYSLDELNELNDYIQHDRDFLYAYAGAKQYESKYATQNRTTKEIYETPQITYMMIGLTLFMKSNDRMNKIKKFYDAVSTFKISLPTPIMGGVRSKSRQFSSCCLIDTADTLDSINSVSSAIVKYVSNRAGIGINAGEIRAIGTPVRNGEAYHTGAIPFYKLFQASVKSVSQGGIRNSAATLNYPIWNYEVENLLVLKNNKGVEDNRVRHLDYCVHISKLFYDRLIKNQDITLFSTHDTPDLYKAFYEDQDLFNELYNKYENDTTIVKKTIRAKELFTLLMIERSSTGRIYIMNVDNVNQHGAFKPQYAPVKMTNLCCLVGDTKLDVCINGVYKTITIKELNDLYNKIDDIKVKSFGIDNGCIEYKPVLESMLTRKNARLVKVTDTTNKVSIICTPDHKIYTTNRGYIRADELKHDDTLIGNDYSVYDNLNIETLDYYEDVYDITVDVNHNFFANGILVHNCEINLPTKPLDKTFDDINTENEIALCTLAAFNLGAIDSLNELPELSDIIVEALDNLLDYQEYPIQAAKTATMNYRPLGVGVINYAYYLAKNGLNYSDKESLELTHRTFEHIQHALITSSNKLAKERGTCKKYKNTKWSDGLLPIDRYKQSVDELGKFEYECDWELLREQVRLYGVRNAVLSAIAPTETSSQISNATNGIEPPRGYVSVKASKDGILKQVVPDLKSLKEQYQLLWDIDSNEHYIKLCAIMQKFVDQSISANLNYDPSKFDGKVPLKLMLTDLLTCYKLGLKTLYYHNTRDGANDSQNDLESGCAGGACKI